MKIFYIKFLFPKSEDHFFILILDPPKLMIGGKCSITLFYNIILFCRIRGGEMPCLNLQNKRDDEIQLLIRNTVENRMENI